jgi:hypothetical protein
LKTPRWPTGPTNHVEVPQRDFKEEYIPKRPSYTDPHFRHPPITFQTVGIPELGVRVGKIVEKYTAPIVGGNDPVFADAGDREVRFWILVCCPHHAWNKRIIDSLVAVVAWIQFRAFAEED